MHPMYGLLGLLIVNVSATCGEGENENNEGDNPPFGFEKTDFDELVEAAENG